jgi:hypothetical protein
MLRFHHTFSQTFNLWKELAPCRSRFLRSQSRTPFPLSHPFPVEPSAHKGPSG